MSVTVEILIRGILKSMETWTDKYWATEQFYVVLGTVPRHTTPAMRSLVAIIHYFPVLPQCCFPTDQPALWEGGLSSTFVGVKMA